jgi:hypothetical protein
MEKIDYGRIAAQPTMDAKLETVEEEINRVPYVIMTDALTEQNRGGQLVMQLLGEDEKTNLLRGRITRKYKLRAIKDEWGNLYYPGDVVKRRLENPKKNRKGDKYTNRALKGWRQSGEYDKMFVSYNEYTVDEKGCIDVSFEDAGYFLLEHGAHYETGYGICGKREHTREPCLAPNGQKLHVHYWRFQEVPPEMYEALPKIERPIEPKKRGRKPKTETETKDEQS